MTEQQREQRGISRRTIAKGAAWAVPALPIVAATPAYAASGAPPTVTAGKVWKWPGGSCANVPAAADSTKAYLFQFQIKNATTRDIYLYDVDITTTSPNLEFTVVGTTPALNTPLAPGATTVLLVWANGKSSANVTFCGTATISWGHYEDSDPDNHPDVEETWYVPATPTTTSAGYEQCVIPPFEAAAPTPDGVVCA